jgi:hypothetical protein
VSPGFAAACAFRAWEAAHPAAPGPVRAMVRDEHADGLPDFDRWYRAITGHLPF